MSDPFNTSGTGKQSQFTQVPGGGTQPEAFEQGQTGSVYDQVQRSQGGDMGGGLGVVGSGVAGGYEGQGQQGTQAAMGSQGQQQQQTGQKQDWLDKGIESAGQKVGVNISDKNADTAGDFVNKEFTAKTGHGIPGVH